MTRSRVSRIVEDAASLLEAEGWDPHRNPVTDAIDRAAGFIPGRSSIDAEQATIEAWNLIVDHLGGRSVTGWERASGRTQLQVVHALRTAATAVTS
ncbi:DUF6197 family protein [Streptomyces sp. SAS_275]|uniref:DUF6197 family protein n=1 Tax=Streptomyces sp. SAS_275 TaxID=3412746 RepID=UPI00403D03B3